MTAPLQPLTECWRPEFLPAPPGRIVVPPPGRAFALAGAAAAGRRLLAIVPGERDAEELAGDVALFTDAVLALPAWETLPFEHVSPNVVTMAHRARARHRLSQGDDGLVVVASVRAATQRVSPSSPRPVVVAVGEEHDRDRLVASLVESGYHRTDRVEGRGEVAVRGAIVDVAPAQGGAPLRLELWGDEVAEIRRFSPATQRSGGAGGPLVAYPAREFRPDAEVRAGAAALLGAEPWAAATWDRITEGLTFPGIESWLPWLAPARSVLDEADDAELVMFDPVRCRDRSRDLVKEESELAAALAPTWGQGAPEAGDHPALYLDLETAAAGHDLLEAPPNPSRPGESAVVVRSLDAVPGDAVSVSAAITRLLADGTTVVVAMDGEPAADRVSSVLAEAGVALERRSALDELRSAIVPVGIHRGFLLPDAGLAVFGEQEIAGRRRSHRTATVRRSEAAESYRDLTPGDYVVHHQHGIGRFEGLTTQVMAGVERDYLIIAYAGQDRLYVPTDQLAAVRRYSGGEAPRLSRMGGADWAATKRRVKQELAAVAEHVVRLHRERALATGHAFPPDSPFQAEFEGRFPYEETPDQLTAIDDVKYDLESPGPMDRLIFGDVGFGKTEVAMRAAFKVIEAGRQAAVLVPTTLLARQHFETFGDRFAPFPVRVEMLSRFLTGREQREVIAGLKTGEVDLVIATHRLLSGDVAFRDLGLLVVDEEQRFGVAAKDAIKALRTSVDVLTLTATPIPRTLEMALAGIRPVSHIRTPPVDRHPILTYVGPYDAQAVSAAIRRELLREGQVFYVHNRVQSIDHALERLRALVPDARYAVAHGQMSEGQLEQVMIDFWEGRYDVLVATTIIESGLDLPQVNTLIVERAERLGLAQLYQLRGRVGRSSQRAYAYLFHGAEERLAEDAYHRLEAIGEYSELGSGFDLALRDLQIRGAGSILGEIQSGHIAAVGLDLYSELVAEAVAELSGEPAPEPAPAQVRIDLPVDAHLPDDYVADGEARLEAYRRLAVADSHELVDDVAAEWRDRYGPLPAEAGVLLELAHLRVEALRVELAEVVQLRHEVRLAPVDLSQSQQVRLERLAPRAVLRGKELFLPLPREDMVAAVREFIRTMWPPP